MFNISVCKRMHLSFYKYFICMCFLISGVVIASYVYNTDFSYIKPSCSYLMNLVLKVTFLVLFAKYLCRGVLRFVTVPVFLIYSGICLGMFLMFTLYNFPLYKFLLTVFPCVFKTTGVMLLFSSCFDFDKLYKNDTYIYIGAALCFLGDILVCLVV